MDLGIRGKTAIVCGASKGLGFACAEALAAEGANIVMCSRSFDRIFQAARSIAEKYGTDAVPIAADVSSPDAPETLVRETVTKFGTVDILINNAGGPPPGELDDLGDDTWADAFQLTLMSAVRMTRKVLPVMRGQRWGRIVNLASISVKQPIPNLLLSNSLRSAVVGMAKTTATEVAADNVCINTIATGIFDTARLDSIFRSRAESGGGSPEEQRAAMTESIPVKRIGDPAELASLAAFLASERAAYITGATIQIDGGSYAGML